MKPISLRTLYVTTLALVPNMAAAQAEPVSGDRFTGTAEFTNYGEDRQERTVSLSFKRGKLVKCDVVKSSSNIKEDQETCQKVKNCAERFPASIMEVRECSFSDQAEFRRDQGHDTASGTVVRRNVMRSPPIGYEKPVGPAVTLYHDCLSRHVQAGVNMDMAGYRGVLTECQEVRAEALKMGDRALSKEAGWSSKDSRLASVNKSLDQTEASIRFLFTVVSDVAPQESPNAQN